MTRYPMWASIASLCLSITSVAAQIGADGFENNPCLRLKDFEIDGNWWASEQGAVDWSSVLEGTRDTLSNSAWRSTQNQCSINPALRWGYYYKAGIFCDTFSINEQSMFQSSIDAECCPDQWVPLLSSLEASLPIPKVDLTNVYYVGSDMDLILCAAVERIDDFGTAYIYMEFNQEITQQHALYPTECDETTGTEWKCWYPLRHDGDLEIAFQLQHGNDITGNIIMISTWNSTAGTNGEFVPVRVEDMWLWTGVPTKYISDDGANRAAVNNATTPASSFGYVCDDNSVLGV